MKYNDALGNKIAISAACRFARINRLKVLPIARVAIKLFDKVRHAAELEGDIEYSKAFFASGGDNDYAEYAAELFYAESGHDSIIRLLHEIYINRIGVIK